MTWGTNYNTLNNNHYTCFNTSGKCSEIKYIYFDHSYNVFYIVIKNGKNIEDALFEMLENDVNKISSNIKGNKDTVGTVDHWYYNNIELKGYSKYIEDTVYCNDRSIYSYGGWNPNGGNVVANNLGFSQSGRSNNPTIRCKNDSDKFTVSDSIGNGALDYPVGLLTADEIIMSSPSGFLNIGIGFWTITPGAFYNGIINGYGSHIRHINNNINISNKVVNDNNTGVRPVISLKQGTRVDGGDGTGDDPYTIEEILG